MSEQSSWGVMAPTLLSSMTVLRDSIHMGSISPSRMIHLGPLCVMLARSRIADENRPAPQRDTRVCLPHAQDVSCGGHVGLGASPKHLPPPSHSRIKPQERSSPSITPHSVFTDTFPEGVCPFVRVVWASSHPGRAAAHSAGVSPSFHSRVAGWITPNSSSQVTAFGSRSTVTGFRFMIWYVFLSDISTCRERNPLQPSAAFARGWGHRALLPPTVEYPALESPWEGSGPPSAELAPGWGVVRAPRLISQHHPARPAGTAAHRASSACALPACCCSPALAKAVLGSP